LLSSASMASEGASGCSSPHGCVAKVVGLGVAATAVGVAAYYLYKYYRAHHGVQWPLTLNQVIEDPVLRGEFRTFLMERFCEENLDFIMDCRFLKDNPTFGQALDIYRKYVRTESPMELVMYWDTRVQIEKHMKQLFVDARVHGLNFDDVNSALVKNQPQGFRRCLESPGHRLENYLMPDELRNQEAELADQMQKPLTDEERQSLIRRVFLPLLTETELQMQFMISDFIEFLHLHGKG